MAARNAAGSSCSWRPGFRSVLVCFSALNVEFRDFRFIVPFIVQFGLFVSPVAFTSANIPERWRTLYALNPMVGIIEGFRWSILGGRSSLGSFMVSFRLP